MVSNDATEGIVQIENISCQGRPSRWQQPLLMCLQWHWIERCSGCYSRVWPLRYDRWVCADATPWCKQWGSWCMKQHLPQRHGSRRNKDSLMYRRRMWKEGGHYKSPDWWARRRVILSSYQARPARSWLPYALIEPGSFVRFYFCTRATHTTSSQHTRVLLGWSNTSTPNMQTTTHNA